MTIPLFCGDAGRGLVIRRGMNSYDEEGRRQDSVAVVSRLPPASIDKINHLVPLISENLQPALDEVFHARS
ncbi:hypothetical protein [Nostoc sp.]|uniref:hypothetical protein n=1 Tax=Nostoc sp. TaxID=1180 RepID=UPI002FFB7454